MRKFSWLLFTGLAFILSGISAQLLSLDSPLPGILISIGGVIKIIFLTLTLRQAKVRPGYEMLFLLFGLGLIILGAQLRNNDVPLALALTATIIGASLKLLFLYVIIRKLRTARISRRINH
ncbi:MAG: hypothetical protein LC643_04300 [Bacteroidales bacterium]|nr:hypothetical protein [Bacteroidales bacterium]